MLERLGPHRRVMMGAAGVAVLLVVLAVTRMGGGEDPFDNLPQVVGSGVVSPAPAAAPPLVPTSPAPAARASGTDGHHGDGFETATLRDPFCPLVTSVASGTAGVNCPEQAPPVSGEPMTVLDVFLDNGVPHVRARVGPRVFTLHVDDPFGDYRVVSLAETCGEFARGAEQQTLCEGAAWGTPPAGANP